MNPRTIHRFLSWLLTGVLLLPLAASADPVLDLSQTVRAATEEMLAVVCEKPTDDRPLAERAHAALQKYFDFPMMTRRAAGPGWREYTPEQQQRITTLLTELVVRSYCSHFDSTIRSRAAYAAPVELAKDRCELPTTIIYASQNFAVTYRAEKIAGNWHIYDVIVEGVSLVANYRAQFNALFQQGGAEAIIHALEENLATPVPAK